MAEEIGWNWIAEHDAELRHIVTRRYQSTGYDAEDALHDAYLYLAERIDPSLNPQSYILWKVRNLIVDNWRVHDRKMAELEDMPEQEDMSETAIASVLLEQTCCTIEQLPAHDQLVMWRRMAGYSQSQIAEMLDIPLGTVKSRQGASVRRLRA